MIFFEYIALREKCAIRSISPYLVRMRENTAQSKLRIWTLFMK